MKKWTILLLILLFAACATERLNIDIQDAITKEKVSRIQKGFSTKEDIVALFGKPLDMVVIDGKETLFYKDFNLRSLWVEFDEGGRVDKFESGL